jgi:hypothetical protein
MPVLDTGIHANTYLEQEKTWMAGTEPHVRQHGQTARRNWLVIPGRTAGASPESTTTTSAILAEPVFMDPGLLAALGSGMTALPTC